MIESFFMPNKQERRVAKTYLEGIGKNENNKGKNKKINPKRKDRENAQKSKQRKNKQRHLSH